MEDTGKTKLEQMLTCPVCRDIFKDPRQLPCGHSMCKGCLEDMRDHSTDMPFRCPDCRGYFGQIIGVQKSFTLSNITEDFRLNKKRRDEQRKCVYCDCCKEKTQALKTCLKCEVSLCKEHVKDHQELPVFTGHPLVMPLSDLQERKCPEHKDEVLRYYCNASRRYICNICSLESKQQNLATEASTVLRRQLTEHVDQRFEILKEQMKKSNESVKKLHEDFKRERQRGNRDDSLLNGVTVVLLCLWFIVLYYAYDYSVENQTLTESLERQHKRLHKIYSTIAELLVEHPTKFHKLAAIGDQENFMLDLETASPFLGVFIDLRTVERVKTKMSYPDKNSRFDVAPQVLSTRCFSTGAHVWEVEVEGYWDIAVSYKTIPRKTKHSSVFGKNDQSWSLTHNGKGKLVAYHNEEKIAISGTLQSNRIAVAVDFEKGTITFSAVNSTITHLHEYKAKLTLTVCLGLGLYRVDPPSKASILKVS